MSHLPPVSVLAAHNAATRRRSAIAQPGSRRHKGGRHSIGARPTPSGLEQEEGGARVWTHWGT
eukprot:756394-Rhodomonas_salina.1